MYHRWSCRPLSAAVADCNHVCLYLQVLTTGSWPTQTAAKCNLPRELEACCGQFQNYYLRAHSGRKLTWQTNMGNADLKVRPAKGYTDVEQTASTTQ